MSEPDFPGASLTRRARALTTITVMLQMYCRAHHEPDDELCQKCDALLNYARKRLENCPFGDAKPACNKCTVHCYSHERRAEIRRVMRWAGPRMLRNYPLLGIRHLIDSWRSAPPLPVKRKLRGTTAGRGKA